MAMFIIVGMSRKSKVIGFSILVIVLIAIAAIVPAVLLTGSSEAPATGSAESQTDAPTNTPTDTPTEAPTETPTNAPTTCFR